MILEESRKQTDYKNIKKTIAMTINPTYFVIASPVLWDEAIYLIIKSDCFAKNAYNDVASKLL